MRLASTMGAAGLLKALTVALCIVGGQAAGPKAGAGSSKTVPIHGRGISQRVKDLVAKMVSQCLALVGGRDDSIRCLGWIGCQERSGRRR